VLVAAPITSARSASVRGLVSSMLSAQSRTNWSSSPIGFSNGIESIVASLVQRGWERIGRMMLGLVACS